MQQTPATITAALTDVLTSAGTIFDTVVPIVIGVIAIGVLAYMVKLVRRG